jgi:hypothetical protein
MGDERTNEVFIEDVFVPDDYVVGEVGKGFQYISQALDLERFTMFTFSPIKQRLDLLCDHVRTAERDGEPLREDPVIRREIARLATDAEVARVLGLRVVAESMKGEKKPGTPPPTVESSRYKLFATEFSRRLANASMDIAGPGGQLRVKTPYAHGGAESTYRYGDRHDRRRLVGDPEERIAAGRPPKNFIAPDDRPDDDPEPFDDRPTVARRRDRARPRQRGPGGAHWWLADYGARVVKVGTPRHGGADHAAVLRRPPGRARPSTSSPGGTGVPARATADVVIEAPARVVDRPGIGPVAVHSVNPGGVLLDQRLRPGPGRSGRATTQLPSVGGYLDCPGRNADGGLRRPARPWPIQRRRWHAGGATRRSSPAARPARAPPHVSIADGVVALMSPTSRVPATGDARAHACSLAGTPVTSYPCADGRWLAVGLIERTSSPPVFRPGATVDRPSRPTMPSRRDPSRLPRVRTRSRTRVANSTGSTRACRGGEACRSSRTTSTCAHASSYCVTPRRSRRRASRVDAGGADRHQPDVVRGRASPHRCGPKADSPPTTAALREEAVA